MKEVIEYCVEYRRDDERKYHRSSFGFKDKEIALRIAEKASRILHSRIVEQKRRVIKTFSLTIRKIHNGRA